MKSISWSVEEMFYYFSQTQMNNFIISQLKKMT